MKIFIYPLVCYFGRFMPRLVRDFLDDVAAKEHSNIKYWLISGVMSLVIMCGFYLLMKL